MLMIMMMMMMMLMMMILKIASIVVNAVVVAVVAVVIITVTLVEGHRLREGNSAFGWAFLVMVCSWFLKRCLDLHLLSSA